MKIIADQKIASVAIKAAAQTAPAKSTMDIVTFAAIEFNGEDCTVTANNMTSTYSEVFKAEGEPGRAAIKLDKLTKASSAKASTIEITDEYLKAGRSKVKMDSVPFDHFPQPEYSKMEPCNISSVQLQMAIKKVAYAMASNDFRVMLNGIHLCNGYVVASDGHRMAFAEIEYDGPSIIIPGESVKGIDKVDGDLFVSDSQIMIKNETQRFTTKLIDAKYADWIRVVPRDCDKTFSFVASDAIDAIRIAMIGGETAEINVSGGRATVKTKGAESEFDCIGDDFDSAFKCQYLIDVLSMYGSENVSVKCSEIHKPWLIDDHHILMPVRM